MNEAEQIRRWIIDNELMSAEDADRWIDRWRAQAAPSSGVDDLVGWLVAQSLLTEFQGEALLAGHSGTHTLGPYRVFERIAAGRLGNIFRAVHLEFNQPVSLKVFPAELKKSPERLARLGREARVSLEVEHPNIVRSFQIGELGDITFLAFEDLQGETLGDKLRRQQKLPIADACAIVRQAALGLEHLHSRDIVHRDVQPGNIWVTPAGTVKLLEFGAARDALEFLDTNAAGENPTLLDVIVGTYEYMAPEQAQNAHTADARSDIYSLGCTLYHCLTGQVPFPDRNPVRQMMRHANEPVKPVRQLIDVPQPLAEVVHAMLAKKPAERYKRAADVAWALEPFVPATAEPEETPKVNQDFLNWIDSIEGRTATGIATVAATPECADFVDWVSAQYKKQ